MGGATAPSATCGAVPRGAALRGILTTVTKFGPNPSVLHENVDALVEHLRARHDVDPAALRAAIAEVIR